MYEKKWKKYKKNYTISPSDTPFYTWKIKKISWKVYIEVRLANDKDITSDITKKDVIEYINAKKESGKWKAISENVFKTCIRNLYKYLKNELVMPADQEGMQRVFELKQIYNKICSLKPSKCDNGIKTDKAMEYRDAVKLLRIAKERDDYEYNCLYLLFYFGFRKSELCTIRTNRRLPRRNRSKIGWEES